MEKRERIHQLMPLVDQIKDEELRNGVVDIWARVWEEGGWNDLADCPFVTDMEIHECNLIQHTNFVATVAMAMASSAEEIWHIPVDTDLLLAGALLHDASKAVEYAPEEGKPGKQSAIGKNLLHGAYTVHLVLNAGLPLRVAHIISSHSPHVSQIPEVIEGVLICHADFAAADTVFLKKGRPLILKR